MYIYIIFYMLFTRVSCSGRRGVGEEILVFPYMIFISAQILYILLYVHFGVRAAVHIYMCTGSIYGCNGPTSSLPHCNWTVHTIIWLHVISVCEKVPIGTYTACKNNRDDAISAYKKRRITIYIILNYIVLTRQRER